MAATSLQFTDPTPRVASAFRQLVRNGRTGPGLLQHESDLTTLSAPQEQSFVVSELLAEYFRKSDSGRLPRIANVIEDIAAKKNAIGILADSLEACNSSTATETAITEMVSGLKLKPRTTAIFYSALCYSSSVETRALGKKLLAAFVRSSPRFNHFITVIDSQATLQQVATIAVESDQRVFDKKDITAPLATMRAHIEFKLPAESVAAGTSKGRLLAKQIQEVGPICVSTLDDAKILVDLHPGLNESDVARALCVMASGKTMPSITPINNATPLWNVLKASAVPSTSTVPAWQAIANAIPASSSHSDPNANTSEWNVGNFALAIKEKRPDLVWNSVIRALDQHDLIRCDEIPASSTTSICTSTAALECISAAYRKVTGANALPFECFLGSWSNAHSQWALLKTIIKNPDLIDRRQSGNSRLLADVLLNAAAAQTPAGGFCPLWRVVDFAAAIVDCVDGVSVRSDVMDFIQSAMKATPAVVICALATCRPTRSVSGLHVLRSLLDAPGVLSSSLNSDVVQCIEQAKALPFLLTVLGDILTRDSGRLASLISVIQSRRLFSGLLNHVPDPRVWALIAISGVESNELSNAIFNEMVQNEKRPLSARALSATGIVEVCDELLSKNSGTFSSCIRAALSSVANATSLTSMIPHIVNQAEVLLNSDCRAIVADDGNFPKEIEDSASRFIESVCRNTVNEEKAIATCLGLSRSTDTKELQLLGCIIFTMLEESRCVGEYPTAERRRFSALFGHLIDQGVLPKAQLQKALLNIMQALLPQNGSDGKSIDPKLQDFAATALMIFKRRLHEWPALAKQVREIQNIDMLVPGIIALLDRPAMQQQQLGDAADGPDGGAGAKGEKDGVEFAISGLHQHDIRVLMNKKDKDFITPSSVVQDRINFLVSNTDPNNIESNAQELADLVKPEIYPFFADYMIVRRVSLEANNHKMYLQLIQKFDSPILDDSIRIATIKCCKKVIASDSVRNETNERSLLKALGSWLGLTTLAKNVPILARELDLTELIPKGIVEGKLIAVVPFIARVLEAASQSRAFAVPNPWLLGILSQLVEMYQLPELKITLRFEVEVLCRNLNVSIEAIADYMKPNPRRWNLIELKNRFIDVSDSFDFKPSQDDQFVSKKLTPDAPEFRPRGAGSPQQGGGQQGNVAQMLQNATNNNNNNAFGPGGNNNNNNAPGMNMMNNIGNNNMMNSGNAMAGNNNNNNNLNNQNQQQQNNPQSYQARIELRAPQEFLQNVPMNVRDSFRSLLQQAGEHAYREVMQSADRPMAIAMVCARDIALKDFCHDADHNALITAAKIMARSLTTHLISVSLRDIMVNAIKKASAAALQRIGVTDTTQLNNESETFARENVDRFAAIIDEATADAAQRHVTDFLTQHIEDRNKMLQQTGTLANAVPPHVDGRPPNLPDHLRPKGTLGNTHRQIFEDFRGMLGTLRSPREQIQSMLRDIEADALRHYQVQPPAPNTILSLTKPEFTSQSLSEYHLAIRQRVIDVNKMVETTADYNIQLTVDTTFKGLVHYSESPGMRRPPQAGDQQSILQYAVAQLLMEVCLFTLQKLRDKFQNRVTLEVTKHFFAHERRWQLREAATSLGRLVLFDFSEFDKELAAALREIAATSHSADRSPAVEFASHFLQRILIESKTATANDLQQTLVELQKIAAAKQPVGVRIPSTFGHDDAGRKARGDLEQVFREWLDICEKRNSDVNLSQPSETRQKPVLAYIQKLQSLGLLKVDRGSDTALERFFSALTEIVVEDYATQLMFSERENMGQNNNQQNNNVNGPKPRAPTSDAKLFASADAFSDLVSVLVKCCTWSSGQPSRVSQAPEVALVTKVLTVIAKVLKHNHNFFVDEKRPQLQLPENYVLQDSFMQQPYLRIMSNLIMHLGPMQAASASSSTTATNPDGSPATDASKTAEQQEKKEKEAVASQTVLEFFNVIATTLHTSLSPSQVPGFAFAWVELLCHRIFVARLLSHPRGWDAYFRMLSDAVKFADQLSQQSQPTNSSMLFYRCLLKILVLLLHDFPDFLLLYHQPLCDLIPAGWVQLRNVVLSAFPKNVKLPDPFSASLQLDQLPEINQTPPLLDYHRDCFKDSGIPKAQVDAFLNGESSTSGNNNKKRPGATAAARNNKDEDFLTTALIQKLKNPQTGKWNTTLINGLVLYVGLVQAEKRQQQRASANKTSSSAATGKDAYWNINDSPALEVLLFLISQPNSNELRSIVVNACANQLRFPNSHTHFFSMALLQLYQYSQHEQQEQVQEIIVRVLLERIVIVRPQPWGLLITFFEIVKSPVYDLQNKSFIRCTPEIERTFEGIFDRLVNAPAAAAAQQQQQANKQ